MWFSHKEGTLLFNNFLKKSPLEMPSVYTLAGTLLHSEIEESLVYLPLSSYYIPLTPLSLQP